MRESGIEESRYKMNSVLRIIVTGFVAAVIGLSSSTTTQGDIVLNVDTIKKEFYFSGSDSGTLSSGGNNSVDGIAAWNAGSSGPRFDVDVVSDVLWSGQGSPGPGSLEPGNEVQLSGGMFIYFVVPGGGGGNNTSGPGETGTFSFVGNRFSYAAASEAQQATIENYATNGLTVPPSGSSIGFQHIRFAEVSAVPEPVGVGIAVLIGVVCWVRRRN